MKYKSIATLGEVTKRRGIAFYHQVYTVLATALADGSISPGSALPSETELMQHFHVSRNTVRRALGQLEKEKRIVTRRGSGSYARLIPASGATCEAIAEVIFDMDSAQSPTSSRLVRVQSGPTPEFIRRRDPLFGDVSTLVQRCRSYQDTPFLLTTSFVPESLARRLTRRHLSQHTVIVALDSIGVVPCTAEQITTAVTADSVAARHLGVDTATALLCMHRLIRDSGGRSIEHQSHFFRPDRWLLQTHLSLDRSAKDLRWQNAKAPPLPAWL